MSVGPEPIAVVGIGCRLPGGADSPAALWQLLADRFDAIGPIPEDRFDAEALYVEGAAAPGKVSTQWGGFLTGVDQLDAPFFEIAPREADRLDPQQRLLLETSWEALDDAGIPRQRIAGTNAAVYVGMWLNEFETRAFADPAGIDLYATTGTGRYTASGRLSFFLDLRGPSVTVDTACSSSLVAVHLACQSLRTGECDLALAGGANVILEPNITIAYSQSGMMARDGRCKFGDAAADGYVRSDGAAIVVLKRLSAAVADGDRIYAVVRASAVTNDGRSSGFLATPGEAGQEEMLRRAYASAGIDPRTVQYVEAHGTGTAAGDPVELGALGAVVGAGRAPDDPCLVGSLKSNVGHTEGAAGVAGLIKAALALWHGEVPASIHVDEPNPRIPWLDLGLEVCREARPWPAHEGPRRAGVSSFGIAGTNAHVVLDEPPVAAPRPSERHGGPLLLPISAQSPAALMALASSYRELLARVPERARDVCAGAATRRSHHRDRLAVVGSDAGELVAHLDGFVARVDDAPAVPGLGRAVFVFPGQGSQWLGMGRELLTGEPAFREAMALVDEAIRAEAGWSPLAELAADETTSRLDEIDVVQPVLFAIQVALAAQWRSWGVEPRAVVGHSMGEAAAAHVAGALSLADAVAVICRRSALLRRIAGQGAMAVVDLGPDEAAAALTGFEDRLAVAVSNSARSSVLSGDPGALDVVLDALAARDVFTRRVKVDVASHSPQVDPLLEELAGALAGLTPVDSAVPMYSTVDAGVAEGSSLDAAYWVRNLREPVRFGDAIGQLLADGCDLFLELSPHPVLLPPVEEVVRSAGGDAAAVASLRREQPERATMLAGLGTAYERGCDVRWEAVVGEPSEPIDLPGYPWQRDRHWYEPARRSARSGDPLLDRGVRLASGSGVRLWETDLGSDELAFLRDHVVLGTAVMPAAGFVEQALLAARHERADACQLRDVELVEMLPIEADAGRAVQLTVEQGPSGSLRFDVLSLPEGGGSVHHASGVIESCEASASTDDESVELIRARCAEHRDAQAHGLAMQARGLEYGPSLRTVTECWLGPGEALGRVTAPVAGAVGLLDGSLQVALEALPSSVAGQTYLPVRIERLRRYRSVASTASVWAHAVLTSFTAGGARCDVTLCESDGTTVLEATGVEFKRLGTPESRLADLFYEVRWEDVDLPAARAEPGTWLVFADGGAGHDLLARLVEAGHRGVSVASGDSFAELGDGTFTVDPTSVADHRALLRAVSGGPELRGIVYALAAGLADDAPGALSAAERLGCRGLVALSQAASATAEEPGPPADPRWWIVTSGAQAIGDEDAGVLNAVQGVLWGLGRVMASEHPERRCTLVDLDPARLDDRDLFAEVTSDADDRQVSWRGDRRRVARLVHMGPRDTPPPLRELDTDTFRVTVAEPGSLDTMHLAMDARRRPGDGEIEVRLTASGINFLDVLKAMGIYPGLEPGADVVLGAEGAGVVVGVGPGVTGFEVGDEVVAITSSYGATSLLASHAVVPAAFAVERPADLSPEVAAALPVAYVTAYYALCELGHLRSEDVVLIHAAAGGVGLAALQLCRDAGATVVATAGSEAKRAYLHSLGVEHVFDSRSTSFAAEVLEVTGGRGVDIVLNSLAGEAIPAGVSALAPRGRFIELGKRDVYAHRLLDLSDLKGNRAFFVVDLAALTEQEPAYVAELFHVVMGMVAEGRIGALPVTAAPITAVAETFRTMARGEHTGKLVLTTVDRPAVRVGIVRPDSTYLITGGLGALGLAVARRFVEQGARHLLLLGRTAPSADAERVLDELRRTGAEVRTVAADVTDPAELGAALAMARVTMPALRGVVHAAGVLADATLGQLDAGRIRAALAPKLEGGRNLHLATLGDPLELFVLFSSVAGVLGLAGQAAYAAGNAYLDALAHARRVAGRPALSIDWGPWTGIGLAAASTDRGERLAGSGLAGLDPDEALDALARLIREDRSHAAVLRIDAMAWADAVPSSRHLLRSLLTAAPAPHAPTTTWATWLDDLPAGPRRRGALEDAICAELAPVLRADADRIDRRRELKAMGLDSLMALELRNRLEARTGLTLPATIAWNHPTVERLAEHLAERMSLPLIAVSEAGEPAGAVSAAVPAGASEAELAALLDDELAAVERLLQSEGSAP